VPGSNLTAGLAGRLHRMGVTHQWLTRATQWTWARLESGFDEDAHAPVEVLAFLAYVPDRRRAEQYAAQVHHWLADSGCSAHPQATRATGSLLSTLRRPPTARGRDIFDDATIDGHLDRMVRDQEPDGGWGITWNAPGCSTLECAGSRHFELCAPPHGQRSALT
jgi:hypothetical protein